MSNLKISKVYAREILDSRGNPTVEAEVTLADITAIFAMSDVMAIGAVRAITDRGLKVPQNISVIGFDGIEMIDYLVPKLATIRQNREEIARQSIEVLMQAVYGRADAVHRVVPFEILTGESTKRLYLEENK